jgi:hypothetical protein
VAGRRLKIGHSPLRHAVAPITRDQRRKERAGHGENVGGEPRALHFTGLALSTEVVGAFLVAGDSGERLGLALIGEDVGSRHGKGSWAELGDLVLDRDEAVGSANGNGLSNTPFTTLNMAVVAPIPSASVSTAMMVKDGFLESMLAEGYPCRSPSAQLHRRFPC